ncbi:MAG: PDC sensor domain-containing protein, partial [Acidobacteria bacterium]|nr:PDC sensor domain-containing protein [Acidobacteriota bacterium]
MRVRLKTKLVLAISGMVFAVVTALSTVYIAHLVRHAIDDSYQDAEFVGHEIFNAARQALEVDAGSTKVDLNDPNAVRELVEDTLQTDAGLNALLQSIIGYSPTIYDVAIVDEQGRALLHTDADQQGKDIRAREDFGSVRDGSFRRQLAVVYGAPRVYDISIPLVRDG